MRFTKQYTLSDCGPVAVLNILKWAGMKVSYKDHIKHLKKECKFVNDASFIGVRWWNIRAALKKIGSGALSVRTYHVRDIEVLQRHVSRGGAFILRYRSAPRTEENPPGHFHYSAVVPHADGESFLWLNHNPERMKMVVTARILESHVLSQSQFGDVPVALLIRKI